MVATTDPYMTEDADDAASLDVLEQSLQAQIKDGNLKFLFLSDSTGRTIRNVL